MRPHLIRAFLILLTATALTRPSLAAKAPPADSTPDVELDRLIITDSPPGSIPFACGWFTRRFTGSTIIPPIILSVSPKDEKVSMWVADRHGKQREVWMFWKVSPSDLIALKNGGQILAIDGMDVTTMDNDILKKLVLEGKAGEPVTLVIRGCGEEMHLFREITVRRISARKEKRLLDEAASRELRPARSLADLPATSEPTP